MGYSSTRKKFKFEDKCDQEFHELSKVRILYSVHTEGPLQERVHIDSTRKDNKMFIKNKIARCVRTIIKSQEMGPSNV